MHSESFSVIKGRDGIRTDDNLFMKLSPLDLWGSAKLLELLLDCQLSLSLFIPLCFYHVNVHFIALPSTY